MNYHASLIKKVSLSEGLSRTYDLKDLILSDNVPKYKKSTKTLIKEFEKEKWNFLNKYLKDNRKILIEDLEKIEDGDSNRHVFFENDHYFCKSDFLKLYTKHYLNFYIKELIKEIEPNVIIEIGVGYGSKLLSTYKKNNELINKKFIGLDISKNGLDIASYFALKDNIDFEYKLFDYRKNSFKYIGKYSSGLLLTIYGLHYKKVFSKKDVLDLIESGITCGVHFEPCSDLIKNIPDKLYSYLCLKYMIFNDYTLNIYKGFEDAYKNGIIDVKYHEFHCGNGLLPGTWIIWKAKI